MVIPPVRVLFCLEVLADVIESLNSGPPDRKAGRSIPGMSNLCRLIESGNLLVYAPPTFVSALHMGLVQNDGRLVATEKIDRLLNFANCDLELDSNAILRKANAVVHWFDNADLYELVGLACAEALGADAFITTKPAYYHEIINADCPEFRDFPVSILDVDTFIRLQTDVRSTNSGDDKIISVFTPQCTRITLPRGATAIDFAYRIHTKVGDRCVKALIKGREVPLNYPVQTGEVIEIVKGAEETVTPEWMTFAVTAYAKRKIQRALKRKTTQQGWQSIRAALGGELRTYQRVLTEIAEQRRCSGNDLAFQVGSGDLKIEGLIGTVQERQRQRLVEQPFWIGPGSPWKLASCCNPLPGDAGVGVLVGSRPVRVHRVGCSNLQSLDSKALRPVEWQAASYGLQLQLTIKNTPDIIRMILNRLAEDGILPDFRGFTPGANDTAKVVVWLESITRLQLDDLLAKVHVIPHVEAIKLTRVVMK